MEEPNQITPEPSKSINSDGIASPKIAASSISSPQSSAFTTIMDFYKSNKIFIFASILGVVVIVVLGYFAFKPKTTPPSETKVGLAVELPETAASGEDMVFRVKVTNQDTQKLSSLKLNLVYPYGVTYVSSSPNAGNLSGSFFTIPDLSPGQNAVVIIKAKIQGSINDEKKLQVELRYKYGTISADFTKTASGVTRLTASDVAINIEGPSQSNNSQLVEYVIKYKNNSDKPISNSRVVIDYPGGFVFASSNPKSDVSSNIWNIGNLSANQEGQISVQGTFKSAQPGVALSFTAKLLVLDQKGGYFTQGESKFTTAISSLPLLVTQSLDQNADRNDIVNPGDRLTYVINYQNNGTVTARGVNIVLTIDSKAIDFNSIQAEGGQINNNTITWNASGVSKLENLSPSETGSVRFDVEVKNPAVKDTSRNIDIKTTVKIKSNEYDTYLPGNDLAVKISTVASLQRSLDFASGSLPPKVGTQTTYKVTLSLKNTTNDVDNSIVTAFIPLPAGSFNAQSIDNKESGNIQFDPGTGKLTWTVGKVAAHTGVFSPIRKVSFNLSINPASSQSGREVLLVKDINWSGKDNFTGEDIKVKAENITTESLSGDNYYNGTVVE